MPSGWYFSLDHHDGDWQALIGREELLKDADTLRGPEETAQALEYSKR